MSDISYKDYLFEILDDIYQEFSFELKDIGNVFVAGGAVRDTLIGKQPKDYDIFVLNDKKDVGTMEREIKQLFKDKKLEPSKLQKTGNSTKLSCVDFRHNGCEIQIIARFVNNINELLSSFDWNVNCFAYNGEIINLLNIAPPSIENKSLELMVQMIDPTNPYSTMGRGFYLSRKLDLPLFNTEIDKIIDFILKNKYGQDYLKKLNGVDDFEWNEWGSATTGTIRITTS